MPHRWSISLTIAHGDGRLLAVLVYPHPAVLRVGGTWMLPIFLAQLSELVGLDRLAFGLGIHGEKLGGIQAQDLVLDRVRKLRIFVLVHQIRLHLQLAHSYDLTLRTAA